jgi:lipopolysaccharide assembly outer membrane protein LptD (OstA)
MMRRALVIVLMLATLAAAAKPPRPGGGGVRVGLWDVKTDRMSANLMTGQFAAPDHVTMTRSDGSTVDGDRAVGNFKLKRISLYGNVVIHDQSGSFGLQSGTAAQGKGPATLTADELAVDDLTRLYDARGNVHYEQADTRVDSQTAHLNDKTHRLELSGNVHIVQGDRTLYADRAAYNTKTGDGEADDNVRMEFPGVTPEIATPKPITVKAPKIP